MQEVESLSIMMNKALAKSGQWIGLWAFNIVRMYAIHCCEIWHAGKTL